MFSGSSYFLTYALNLIRLSDFFWKYSETITCLQFSLLWLPPICSGMLFSRNNQEQYDSEASHSDSGSDGPLTSTQNFQISEKPTLLIRHAQQLYGITFSTSVSRLPLPFTECVCEFECAYNKINRFLLLRRPRTFRVSTAVQYFMHIVK